VLNSAGLLSVAFFVGRAFQRLQDHREELRTHALRIVSLESSPIAIEAAKLSVNVDHLHTEIQDLRIRLNRIEDKLDRIGNPSFRL